jgi:hypothetical protein
MAVVYDESRGVIRLHYVVKKGRRELFYTDVGVLLRHGEFEQLFRAGLRQL